MKDVDSTGVSFSTFAVVRNPSDHWPLYSCIIVAVGLTSSRAAGIGCPHLTQMP